MSKITPDGQESLTARLRMRYAELSRAERRLADAILDCPGEVASYSATELAGIAQVSKTTVSRLVRRLGFLNYEQARLASREATASGSPLYLLRKKVGEDIPLAATAHWQRCIDNLEGTSRLLDQTVLTEAIEALAKARRIWLVGMRNNYYLAAYARWQFIQMRPAVHLLLAGAGETLAETLSELDKGDLLVVMGIRRRPALVQRVLRHAQERDIPLLYIGDAHTSLNAKAPVLSLLCETHSLTALDNHVAAFGIIHLLAAGLMDRLGPAARERIRGIEEWHEDLGEM
ncbi:MurR/RpiR family transcriptional regulator [Telmatospirillum sp. J64-1]|uniref:MurR/RpiR family transcriptional regulator n=1 Tax=Telmatospirillum sp. J64-1 TaxID=2502183 RepID=UPI00115E5028|nr:MurR/RpiR family transcriptional regulator [Telmatospirillum sp. J64-1]